MTKVGPTPKFPRYEVIRAIQDFSYPPYDWEVIQNGATVFGLNRLGMEVRSIMRVHIRAICYIESIQQCHMLF